MVLYPSTYGTPLSGRIESVRSILSVLGCSGGAGDPGDKGESSAESSPLAALDIEPADVLWLVRPLILYSFVIVQVLIKVILP